MGLVPARDDDSVDMLAGALRRLDELERWVASRGGKPPTVAWGEVGYAEATSSQAGITTVVDLTSLTVTWTVPSTRKYLFKFGITAQQVTSAGNIDLILADGSNTVVWKQTFTIPAASHMSIGGVKRLTLNAGSQTYKLRASTSAGTLTVNGAGGSTSTLHVQDVGP